MATQPIFTGPYYSSDVHRRGGPTIARGEPWGTPEGNRNATYVANCLNIIELAAAHLHIDPAVLAERLAALPGGGIGELVDAATGIDDECLSVALKPFEKE